jgi:UTP-glucose-1-phosphate uridylyltransferase/mevalonate kinase
VKIFVPGRICLFGEHSDWAGGYRRINAEIEKGYALLVGTNQGIYAEITPHPTSLVITSTNNDGKRIGPYEIPMEPDILLEEAQKGDFWSYAAGVAYQILTNYHVRGLVIDNYKTDLPMKKGLSSSAAICVLVARAFNRVYDLKMTIRGEMELAYQGEILTPSRCGRMDQGCAYGDRPILMTFDGERIGVDELRTPKDLHLLIVDLQASKDTKEILARLNRAYPFADNALEEGVQELLGPINKRIVGEAVDALQNGDARRIGELMIEAQEAFDKYAMPVCPQELTAPVLHRVLNEEAIKPYVWGGKGVGSQGDGTAQFIAKSKDDRETVIDIIEREFEMPCLRLDICTGTRVRKAVIPAAGFGTRMFPASKAVKKELFPVIDRDGIAKPAILIIVEEALSAGIEEICIIVQEEDLPEFQRFFSDQVSIENFNKLSRESQDYARRILDMGRRVSFVFQRTQEGFGHAVYQAKDWIGNEPFLLLLGDHIYRSNSDVSCARQIIEAYNQHGLSVVGMKRTPGSEVSAFGTLGGIWIEPNNLLNITEFAEKPTLSYAEENLHIQGIPDDEYLTVFGQYIIKPQVFDYLEENITNNVRERGEFQLTSCLDRLRREDGFLGVVVEGQRFDIGMPVHYAQTVNEYRGDEDE